MAGTTGLEPAASAVTGQRSNQLNYVPTRQIGGIRARESARLPMSAACKEGLRSSATRMSTPLCRIYISTASSTNIAVRFSLASFF